MLLLLLFLILSCWSLYILLLLLFFVSLVCPWRVCTFTCREFLCGPMECWEESCNKASFSSFAFSCCRTTSTKHGANGHWTNDTTWRSKNDLAFGIGCDKHDILIHPVSWYSKNLLPKPWFLAAKVPCQWHVLVLSTAGGLCKIPRPWSSHHLPLKWILGPWWSQIWKKKWKKVGEKKQTKRCKTITRQVSIVKYIEERANVADTHIHWLQKTPHTLQFHCRQEFLWGQHAVTVLVLGW